MSVEQKIESFEINDTGVDVENKEIKEIIDRISNEIATMKSESNTIHPLYELQYYEDYLRRK